jgi:glycosyltransferase involved in cell wall biosynthesis
VPAKGVTVFARIAAELDRRRPDIPILVVEARGTADGLANVGLDLSGLKNLHRMANTPDPRDFYRVARAVLMPSLWLENGGLVAREAMANGLPVLASDRGGLPETLGDAGFLFEFTSFGTCRDR